MRYFLAPWYFWQYHQRYSRQYATHASTSPTLPTLAHPSPTLACHRRQHSNHVTHASSSSLPFLKLNFTTSTFWSMFQRLAVREKNILRKRSTVYQSLNKVAIFPKMKLTLDLAEEALKVLVYYRKTSFAQTFFC